MRPLLLTLAVVVGFAAAACGSQDGPPPAPATLGATALPELDSAARTLDTAAVAFDAFDMASLEELLVEAGFETGSEREFSGKTKTFDHVVARTLVFETEDGALAYLDWLRGHGDDVLGRAVPATIAPPGEDGIAFELERCGTCKKELPTFLAGWRREDRVLTLLAAGSGANPARFTVLVREHDEAAA
ncbi:MAG TPA: hypothetical protein VLA87_01710 [Gaiellaceae bacterium]|nr:hypothetical protein [Gaiellaceae bacterium]